MSYLTFKKVRCVEAADAGAINITLFRGSLGHVCGWYLGPVSITETGVDLPYLPKSERARASLAIVRAIEAGRAARAPVCIIDPDDLWEPAWRG